MRVLEARSAARVCCVSLATLAMAACGTAEKKGNNRGLDPSTAVSVGKPDPKDVQNSPTGGTGTPDSNGKANPAPNSPELTENETPKTNPPEHGTGVHPQENEAPSPQQPVPTPTEPGNPGTVTPPRTPVLDPNRTVVVNVKDLQNQEGVVCYAMFGSPDGFPGDANKAISSGCFEITVRPLRFTLENVPQGTYGLALWHDENRDGKLNENFLGIPKEGLAFSRDARPRLAPPPGPPSFEQVAFKVEATHTEVSSTMLYLLR